MLYNWRFQSNCEKYSLTVFLLCFIYIHIYEEFAMKICSRAMHLSDINFFLMFIMIYVCEHGVFNSIQRYSIKTLINVNDKIYKANKNIIINVFKNITQCCFNKTSIKEITRLDPEGMTDLYCWLEPPLSKGVSGRFNRAFHALGLLWQIIAPAAYSCGTLRYNVKYDMAMNTHRLRQVGHEKPQP